MSRESDTYFTIDQIKTALIGEVDKTVIILLPLISQIAISLASIADSLNREEAE